MNIVVKHQHNAAGFTLVEILIVVVILGILAAIVIPQFTNASDSAKASTMKRQLQTLRRQLDMYKLHHNEDYPTQAQLWANMINRTDADGTLNAAGAFGPYLERAPMNVFTNSATVTTLGTGTSAQGWEYDPADGTIQAVGFNEATGEFTQP